MAFVATAAPLASNCAFLLASHAAVKPETRTVIGFKLLLNHEIPPFILLKPPVISSANPSISALSVPLTISSNKVIKPFLQKRL